jgi:hypothetical protein
MRLLLLALLVGLSLPARAFQNATGSNGAEFLRIGAGARALGMGEAYGSVAEGAEAIYWNPAGLAYALSPQFTYSRQEFASYFHHDFAAYAQPVRLLRGSIGISYTRLSQESLPVVTNANQTVGRFSPHSDAVSLGYAHAFDSSDPERSDREYFADGWNVPGAYRPLGSSRDVWSGSLMVGFAVKGIYEEIYNRDAHAFALDAGALFKPAPLHDLTLSLAVRHLGGKEEFVREATNLPAEVDLGASYDFRSWKSRFLPAVEVSLPVYGNPAFKLGAEYEWPVGDFTRVAVRGGYRTQTVYDLSPLSGITFGVGGQYKKFTADFGFQPMAELGNVFRMTLGFRW